MSGIELGVAIAEAVVLTSKAFRLIDKIKRNVGLAERNRTFASALVATLQNVRAIFVSKQTLDDWQLKGMNPSWQREIPQALADLERCKDDLEVVAGTDEGRKIYSKVKNRVLAVANAEKAAHELRHIDQKLSMTSSRILALETGDLVIQQGEHVAGQVVAQVDRVVEEVRRQFQSRDGLIEAVVQEPRGALALPNSPTGSVVPQTPAVAAVPLPGPLPSSVVKVTHTSGASLINYEEDRNNVEAMFPQVAAFLRRLESRRIGVHLSENEYDSLKTAFRNLWAPWEIDSSLLEPVFDKGTGRPRELGRGAYGTVFAYKLKTQNGRSVKVAVKAIDPDLSSSEFKCDFFREASLCYRLCHPCVVKFYGAQWPSLPRMKSDDEDEDDDDSSSSSSSSEGTATSEARLILERMDGDLASATRAGKLSNSDDVLRALADAAEALAYMHQQGVLHLDVKPENILVRASGGRLLDRAKITDFGVSLQKRDRMTRLTTTRSHSSVRPKAIGTPAFIAPELYSSPARSSASGASSSRLTEPLYTGRGMQSTLSPACDIYSLGITLAAALSPFVKGGEVPPPVCFSGGQESIKEAAKTGVLAEQVAEWMRKVFKDRPALLTIATACTRLRAEERPRMAHVHKAVQAVANGEEVADIDLTPKRAPAVEDKSADEMCDIAWQYGVGDSKAGIAKDDIKAVFMYRLAADKGSVKAIFNLGVRYANGRGVAKDEKEAARLYKIAAGRGSAKGMNALGWMYTNGRGVEKDEVEAARLYKMGVDVGDAAAMNNLGRMYRDGRGVRRDAVEAARLFQLSAYRGNEAAMNSLGHMFDKGHGVREKKVKAARLFKEATDKGYAPAMHNLGLMYRDGRGVGKDFVEAVRLFKLSADGGHAAAMDSLGGMYRDGCGVLKDEAEAARQYKLAADGGIVTAMHNLGCMFRDGRGVRKDFVEAVRLFKLSSDGGYAAAMDSLGSMHRDGRGVLKDEVEAVRLYKLAADRGDVRGMDNLGCMYLDGRGVRKIEAEAVRLFTLSADGGNKNALVNLGWMHENGRGVFKDEVEAARLYGLAADGGNSIGMSNLGLMYENGRGVEKNEAEAVRLYKLAADGGNVEGMFNLGWMYEHGRGVRSNIREAKRLYARAADGGFEKAKNRLWELGG